MTSGTEQRVRVVVHGHVQGVFFRDSCRQEAAAAGLSGWVRNTPKHTVEAVFEGQADAVGRMVDWCRTGPSRAQVTDVEVHQETPEGLMDFAVLE
ncbi:MAG: acylphosphatase [Actinomycetota bacterium]|nr:acylphosphatase [Actinomycetota bacterium]